MRVRVRWGGGGARRALEAARVVLFAFGGAALAVSGWLQFERHYFGRRYLAEFERVAAVPRPPPTLPASTRTVATPAAAPPARLSIPRVGLVAPVLGDVDRRSLRRGVGWIPGTAAIGSDGNIGIAGHRDTFFGPLREVQVGDRVRLETADNEVRSYVIRSLQVVEPERVDVLKPTANSTLTLVTCFPFDYVGPAPRRWIVRAEGERAGDAGSPPAK